MSGVRGTSPSQEPSPGPLWLCASTGSLLQLGKISTVLNSVACTEMQLKKITNSTIDTNIVFYKECRHLNFFF